MANKPKPLASGDDNALVEAVCNSAHQIWQAGLGAFSRGREEGEDMFSKLVQDGAQLQKRLGQSTDKGLGLADAVARLAESVGKQASGSLEKLEKVFEERVSRSLRSIGVPTQEDIKALSRQIEELNKSVAAMGSKKAAPAKRPAKAAAKAEPKAPVKRPAAKSSAAKAGAKKQPRTAATQA
jgi:poly(hydroxyalkanoate) granule-associated protein